MDYLIRNEQPNKSPVEVGNEEEQEDELRINSIVLRYGPIENIDWFKSQSEFPNFSILRSWGIKQE